MGMLVTYDSCYIHRGCVGGASYSFGIDKDGRPDSMGAGWYCNDGQYVDSSTQYDQCQIHKGCHSGVYYDETTQVWRCNDHAGRNPWSSYSAPGSGSNWSSADSCYIHRGCVGGASYSFGTDKDGRPDSMGAGWYCNDGQYVDGSTQYDQCQIHTNCQGVYYDESTQVWRCNDHADRNLRSSYALQVQGLSSLPQIAVSCAA